MSRLLKFVVLSFGFFNLVSVEGMAGDPPAAVKVDFSRLPYRKIRDFDLSTYATAGCKETIIESATANGEKVTTVATVDGKEVTAESTTANGEKITTIATVDGKETTTVTTVDGKKTTTVTTADGKKITTVTTTANGKKITAVTAVDGKETIDVTTGDGEKITTVTATTVGGKKTTTVTTKDDKKTNTTTIVYDKKTTATTVTTASDILDFTAVDGEMGVERIEEVARRLTAERTLMDIQDEYGMYRCWHRGESSGHCFRYGFYLPIRSFLRQKSFSEVCYFVGGIFTIVGAVLNGIDVANTHRNSAASTNPSSSSSSPTKPSARVSAINDWSFIFQTTGAAVIFLGSLFSEGAKNVFSAVKGKFLSSGLPDGDGENGGKEKSNKKKSAKIAPVPPGGYPI